MAESLAPNSSSARTSKATHVSPAWSEEGAVLSFGHATRDGDERRHSQQLLLLNSAEADPVRAAEDMAEQLFSTSPEDWVRNFGYDVR